MYMSIKFFFSLLFVVHFCSLNFRSAAGLENSVYYVTSFLVPPISFDLVLSNSPSSFSLSLS